MYRRISLVWLVTSPLIHFRSDLVEFVPCSISSRCLKTFDHEVIRKFQTWRDQLQTVHGDTRVWYYHSVSHSHLCLIDEKHRRSSPSFSVESYSCKMAGDPKKLYKQLRNEPGTSPHDLEILGPSQTKAPVYNYTVVNSPPQVTYPNLMARSISSDDESPLVKTIPRKTLIFLISTLNAAFEPDYEFSSCTSQDFSRETNLEVRPCFSLGEGQLLFALVSKKCRWFALDLCDERLLSSLDTAIVVCDRRRDPYQRKWNLQVSGHEVTLSLHTSLSPVSISYRPDGTSDPFSESGIIWSFNFFFHNRKLRRVLFVTGRADCKTSIHDNEDGEEEEMQSSDYLAFEGWAMSESNEISEKQRILYSRQLSPRVFLRTGLSVSVLAWWINSNMCCRWMNSIDFLYSPVVYRNPLTSMDAMNEWWFFLVSICRFTFSSFYCAFHISHVSKENPAVLFFSPYFFSCDVDLSWCTLH